MRKQARGAYLAVNQPLELVSNTDLLNELQRRFECMAFVGLRTHQAGVEHQEQHVWGPGALLIGLIERMKFTVLMEMFSESYEPEEQ